MVVTASVFKAYDIRGLYPTEVNEELAYKVGKAFVTLLSAKKVVVGIDMRTSSESLYKELARGITEQGAHVDFIGMCTTPTLNFAVAHYGYDGGIMVSASHNPGNYNAFKLIKKPAIQISAGDGMEEIKQLVMENDFVKVWRTGTIKPKEVLPEYLNHIKQHAHCAGLKVVADYGNGVGSLTAKQAFNDIGVHAIALFDTPDGRFPNHEANPHELANFSFLQKEVLHQKADLGIFFDGDADRAAFVDEKGMLIPMDFSYCLQAMQALKEQPGETVYYDLRFSKIVKEKIEELNGEAIMVRVGNPYYKKLLAEKGGILGAEFSGHVMYKENYSIDDGLYSAIKLMNIVAEAKKKKQSISKLVKPLQKYVQTPEINIKVKDFEEKENILKAIKAKYPASKYTLTFLDGITVEDKKFWFNVRSSNTEPIIRIRMEAHDAKALEKAKKELLNIIA